MQERPPPGVTTITTDFSSFRLSDFIVFANIFNYILSLSNPFSCYRCNYRLILLSRKCLLLTEQPAAIVLEDNACALTKTKSARQIVWRNH